MRSDAPEDWLNTCWVSGSYPKTVIDRLIPNSEYLGVMNGIWWLEHCWGRGEWWNKKQHLLGVTVFACKCCWWTLVRQVLRQTCWFMYCAYRAMPFKSGAVHLFKQDDVHMKLEPGLHPVWKGQHTQWLIVVNPLNSQLAGQRTFAKSHWVIHMLFLGNSQARLTKIAVGGVSAGVGLVAVVSLVYPLGPLLLYVYVYGSC